MTETDSMVVRVAKAMFDIRPCGDEDSEAGVSWEAMGRDWQDVYRLMARAAIEAMKTPTPAVLEEGYDKLDFYDEQSDAADQYNREVVERVWSAMIVKALEE